MIKVYSAEWCQPCKQVKALLDKNNINYEVVDIDSNSEEARALGIRGIPTLINDEGTRLVGAVTFKQIEETLLS